MSSYELCKKIIQDKCVKPVLNVKLNSTSFHIYIQFEDCTEIIHKLDKNFKHFISIMQHVHLEKKFIDPTLCIKSPLLFYDIFGFVSGDTARFWREGIDILISFL